MLQPPARCQLGRFGDTGGVRYARIDADVWCLVEVGKQVPDEAFPDLLIEVALVYMDNDALVRFRLVGGYRKVDVVDAGLYAGSFLNLFRGPLAFPLDLNEALSVHDKKTLFHGHSPVAFASVTAFFRTRRWLSFDCS